MPASVMTVVAGRLLEEGTCAKDVESLFLTLVSVDARGRVISLAIIAILLLVGVLKQPLLAPLLWPLIPALLVGFWRDSWCRTAAPTKSA